MKRLFSYLLCFCMLTSSAMASSAVATETAQPDPIRVALIDSGINTQIVDEKAVLQGNNYVRTGYTTDDTLGHGTAVAQLILRHAPNAKLIPLTYCDDVYGDVVSVDLKTVSQMIIDAVDVYDCDVINISAGTKSESNDLKTAIAYAEEQDVVVVSAVGNGISDRANYPANYDTVIGVGALNQVGGVASFSANLGVSVVALGERLQITLPTGREALVTGTSFACGEITASVVKLLEGNGELTPEEVREELFDQATDIGEKGFDQQSGYGKIFLTDTP